MTTPVTFFPALVADPGLVQSQFHRRRYVDFFCHAFSWALLRANSCARQLRGFCFPGSVQRRLEPKRDLVGKPTLPKSTLSLWEQRPLASGCPRKMGQEQGEKFMAYLKSGTII